MDGFAKSIKLFLIDGTPNGRWICELSNWTGKAFKIPRTSILKCDDRKELKSPGLYFLFGRNDLDQEVVYIGESENVLDRIKQHLTGKDYWTECVIFISKDDFLNKAHIKYLENRFHKIAAEVSRYKVMNSNSPTKSSLSEADIAELEEFIYNARLMINTLGFKAFEPLAENFKKDDAETLSLSIAGVSASGQVTSEGFVLFKGSSVCKNPAGSLGKSMLAKRDKYISEGKIDKNLIITEDILFASPSGASDFVLGYSSSGPQTWKNRKGQSLKEIESLKSQNVF